jgi:hypothetical protein
MSGFKHQYMFWNYLYETALRDLFQKYSFFFRFDWTLAASGAAYIDYWCGEMNNSAR